MEALVGFAGAFPWADVARSIADMAIKAAFVCGVAFLVNELALRRSSAYARNTVWIAALAVVVLLPFATFVTPHWHLNILPASPAPSVEEAGLETRLALVEGPLPEASRNAAGDRKATADASRKGAEWAGWIVLVWALGAAGTVVLSYGTRRRVGRMVASAKPAETSWLRLAEEIAGRLGVKRPVELCVSGEIKAAVTVGIARPVVVLPACCDAWPRARRRFVLSHELAHVKRRDGIVEIAAIFAIAIQWFNPVVRLALRQLRVERERDCDDAVLNAGARPSDYAMMLMDIAADLGASTRPIWQLTTISQGSSLKERLMCILDPKIDRRRGPNATSVIAAALVLCMIAPATLFGLGSPDTPTAGDARNAVVVTGDTGQDTAAQSELQKKTQEEEKKRQHAEQKKMEEEKKRQLIEKKKKKQASIEAKWKEISAQENSAAALVARAIDEGGIEKGQRVFKKIVGDESAHDYYVDEKEFNILGYVYLREKRVKEAVVVFEMNAKRFPDSWNVWDSLGESYLVAGKYEKAKKLYEKSIELNPENENGRKMLEKIAVIEKKKSGKAM